jgi:hypothetical protein
MVFVASRLKGQVQMKRHTNQYPIPTLNSSLKEQLLHYIKVLYLIYLTLNKNLFLFQYLI